MEALKNRVAEAKKEKRSLCMTLYKNTEVVERDETAKQAIKELIQSSFSIMGILIKAQLKSRARQKFVAILQSKANKDKPRAKTVTFDHKEPPENEDDEHTWSHYDQDEAKGENGLFAKPAKFVVFPTKEELHRIII